MEKARRAKSPLKLSSISAILKDERLNAGMTQVQASRQFGISLKALRNLEQGIDGVPISTASKILSFFGKELRVGDIVLAPHRDYQARPRKDSVLETLRLIRPILAKKFHVQKIALFGSVARDEATKKSDIDLAVVFDQEIDFELLGRLTVFLETLLEGQKVDLVEEQKMFPAVKKQARKDFLYVD